jgi:hypothetical protein
MHPNPTTNETKPKTKKQTLTQTKKKKRKKAHNPHIQENLKFEGRRLNLTGGFRDFGGKKP